MKKDSLNDYLAYITLKAAGPFIRALPLEVSFFLGRRLGDLFYVLDFKHKAIVYANLKKALAKKLSPIQIRRLTRGFYQNLCQSIVEIFLIPLIDQEYIKKYISIESIHYIEDAFKRGKGIILLGVHSGSWEISNIVCANLGFPFRLFVRGQEHPRLEGLLNQYRRQKGCRFIQRENQLRELISAFKNNEAIGMTADQGGKSGLAVNFFGQTAAMPTGAIRLALKYGIPLIPVFYTRRHGPYIKIILKPPLEIKTTDNREQDVAQNLERVVGIFEELIRRYPQDYFWRYRIWKYTREKNILILSDEKAGHLRQSQALAKLAGDCLKDKGFTARIDVAVVKFKNKCALQFCTILSGKYHCQGCLWCLKNFLEKDSYRNLISQAPDIVISCGSALAAVNFVLAKENQAKSIVLMQPGLLGIKKFDLVVIPRHDHPQQRKNVVVTEGALNLIDAAYLNSQATKLLEATKYQPATRVILGLLIGGDTKTFSLKEGVIREIVRQAKATAEKFNADILLTTSRRTSPAVEAVVKEELSGYPRCRFLVIANENNPSFAFGGILALSNLVISSPESISMICEAVNARKNVIVFACPGLPKKHQGFIRHFTKNKYITLTQPQGLSRALEDILLRQPKAAILQDNLSVSQALHKIL